MPLPIHLLSANDYSPILDVCQSPLPIYLSSALCLLPSAFDQSFGNLYRLTMRLAYSGTCASNLSG
jgi:hypothetical protein